MMTKAKARALVEALRQEIGIAENDLETFAGNSIAPKTSLRRSRPKMRRRRIDRRTSRVPRRPAPDRLAAVTAVEFRLPMPPNEGDPVPFGCLVTPVAWSRASGGRTVRLFTPKKQRNNAAALRIMAQQQMQGRLPFDCAIIGQITAEMAIPKTWSKKKQQAALCGEIWPAKRPDLSNICKQVEDALNGVVFRDDALIVRYDTMQKRYSAQPKIVATYQPVRK